MYYHQTNSSPPVDYDFSMSIWADTYNIGVETEVESFSILMPTNDFSVYKFKSEWGCLGGGFDAAITHPIVLLDDY